MGMKTVHISIDRLIVDGLPPSQQRQFLSALERRLRDVASGRLAEAVGSQNRRRHIDTLDAGMMGPGASSEQAARQVAEGVRRALGGGVRQGARVNAEPHMGGNGDV
jgi:hypothetical protein